MKLRGVGCITSCLHASLSEERSYSVTRMHHRGIWSGIFCVVDDVGVGYIFLTCPSNQSVGRTTRTTRSPDKETKDVWT